MKKHLHFLSKIVWVATSVVFALMVDSPFQLCVVSLLFLVANATDTAVQLTILGKFNIEENKSIAYLTISFYLLSCFFSLGVISSAIWFLLS